jgi:glycosyltransferase involved in cell wall biosynthesis
MTKTLVHGVKNLTGRAERQRRRVLQSSTGASYGGPEMHPQSKNPLIRKSNWTRVASDGRLFPIERPLKPKRQTVPPAMRIAFSWNGLPQFAARLIRGALDRVGENSIVVGSRPSVPVLGMEEALNRPVHWLEASQATNWQVLGCEVPDIFVQSGWAYPAFSSLGREVKQRGGYVIGLSDANWRGDFRQLVLGALAFRALHRRHFDAMIVPGRQGQRLMRWFGMPAHLVRSGMLGADPTLFGGGDPLPLRPRTFLFAGQFIARKDVIGLANAFIRFSRARPEWTLHLCGGGEQRKLIPRHARIIVEDFVQPALLAEHFRHAQFFVLPSLFEAWGQVVHEASLSGCALVLSDCIGSADDLATERNGIRFQAGNEDDLVRALHEAADFDDARLLEAGMESLRLARDFGPDRFGREVADLIDRLAGEANCESALRSSSQHQ